MSLSYCEKCKYNGQPVFSEPCRACCFGSNFVSVDSPDKPEPKQIYISTARSNGKSALIDMITKDVLSYCSRDVIATQNMYSKFRYERPPLCKPKKVIFNDPCTIVIWPNNTKTIVKAQNGDTFDPEKGLAMAIAKKAYGDNGKYYDIFKKWIPKNVEKPPVIKEVPIREIPAVPGKVRCSGNCDVCCPVSCDSKAKAGKNCKSCNTYISHFEKKGDK